MTKLDDVLSNVDADLDAALERLFAILRIKSISTDPAYAGETAAPAPSGRRPICASIGFDAAVRDDAGPPDGRRPRPSGHGPVARCSTATTTCSRSIRSSSGSTIRSSPSIETRADGSKMLIRAAAPRTTRAS